MSVNAGRKPLEDRLKLLEEQKANAEMDIAKFYSRISEQVQVIEGIKSTVRGMEYEITRLKEELGYSSASNAGTYQAMTPNMDRLKGEDRY